MDIDKVKKHAINQAKVASTIQIFLLNTDIKDIVKFSNEDIQKIINKNHPIYSVEITEYPSNIYDCALLEKGEEIKKHTLHLKFTPN